MRFRVNIPVYVISPQVNLFKGDTGVPYVWYKHTVECSANIISVNRDVDLAKRGRKQFALV